MWIKTENSEPVKPPKFEKIGDTVILRKNFVRIPGTEDRKEHYEYEEWQMRGGEYDMYKSFEEIAKEQSDALVELAELISEVM